MAKVNDDVAQVGYITTKPSFLRQKQPTVSVGLSVQYQEISRSVNHKLLLLMGDSILALS